MALNDRLNDNAQRAAEKKAARLAAYFEEYGAEEAEISRELRSISLFAAILCAICGIISAIPWHPFIAWVVGIGGWLIAREDLLRRRKTAQERRQLYGLD